MVNVTTKKIDEKPNQDEERENIEKVFIPDEFMFCSESHLEKSKHINIEKYIWEVPIQNKERPNREATLKSLGLDPSFLHVLNVAIFNQNKNQKYIFDIAEKLKNYKVVFHFIGNQCFLNDCEIPDHQLSQSNCKIWGERSDVDVFMSCMDIFLFPSFKELNPLTVKEAISWDMTTICKKCETYTNKYKNKNNFYILEEIDIKKIIIEKTKELSLTKNQNIKKTRFALYTSFFNCEKYVDQIFDQVKNLKYDNFTWFITDDFSTDNTKNKIFEKLKLFNNEKIIYVEQENKKQMYWRPNDFINKSYEYVVLVDADDFFDLNFLNIYNHYLISDPSIYLLTSDFKKINETNLSLHSIGLVDSFEPLKYKINKFHPSIDYLTNLNYYCLGTLRCFKNITDLKFEINSFDACAEDSYRCMFMNSIGKWLHLPRNLYSWMIRSNSESHATQKENFNANFDIAYQKLLNSDSLFDPRFASVYKETCVLNFLDINFNTSISLFTKTKNTKALQELYFDKKIFINDFGNFDYYIFVLNNYTEDEIKEIISKLKNKNANLLFYRLNDSVVSSHEEKDKITNEYLNGLINFSAQFLNDQSWFSYIRHYFVWGSLKQNNFNPDGVNWIDVYDFDAASCRFHYRLKMGLNGRYTLNLYDVKTNLWLYTETLDLCQNLNFWTCFNFYKQIIYKDILIVFKYNDNIVFEKTYEVNKYPLIEKSFFEKTDFNREIKAASYIEVFIDKQYSKHDIEVEKNDITVDIGCNEGAFVKLAILRGASKIYACEPNPKCISLLKKHYSHNNNFYLSEYGISNKNSQSFLQINENDETTGSATLIESENKNMNHKSVIAVKVNTFKNFLQENAISKIDFLKIDCEGGENFIFVEENIEFIKKNVNKIAVEYHNEGKTRIKNMLQENGFKVIDEPLFDNDGFLYAKNNFFEKRIINISNESGSLGDFLAWTPIVNKYAKEKNVKINYYTPYKSLLQDSYPDIIFHDYNQKPNLNSIDMIPIGCFDDINWRTMNLQEVACSILDIESIQEKPILNNKFKKENNFSKKYVCIATQSTAQCKYWNNEAGWNRIVYYLKSIGYEVVCIDKHSSFGIPSQMNFIPNGCINKTGDLPLEDRINDLMHCEFFIGLGSGLSWLAWACDKPVIMISGFSDPKSEFYTPYRVHNKNVCNSCWNDPDHKFDPSNWLWCPRNKNFECSKEISFEMVKEKIDECVRDLKPKDFSSFYWGEISNSFKNLITREIFEENIYEKFFTVEKNDVVVDIGASVGPFIYSILHKNPKKCYAIEALFHNIKILNKNLTATNTEIIHGAITCEKEIEITWDNITETVPTFSFAELLKKYNILKIDFLKCDCEGGEYEVFQQKNMCFLKTIPKIVAEFHIEDSDKLYKYKFKWFIEKILPQFSNYKVYSIDGIDIKCDLYNENFLNYYNQVVIYIDNR